VLLVPGERIELSTQGFSVLCSTTELPRQVVILILIRQPTNSCAPSRIRTCDILLKRQLLYQLSYERILYKFITKKQRPLALMIVLYQNKYKSQYLVAIDKKAVLCYINILKNNTNFYGKIY
jgi:hypothetical protein